MDGKPEAELTMCTEAVELRILKMNSLLFVCILFLRFQFEVLIAVFKGAR